MARQAPDRATCQVGNRVLARIDFTGGRVKWYVLKGMTAAERDMVSAFFETWLWPDLTADAVFSRLFATK